jgi:hypothetical protein
MLILVWVRLITEVMYGLAIRPFIGYPIVHGFRLGPMGWELYANQYVSEENSYYVNDWLEL